jgi:acetate kinase
LLLPPFKRKKKVSMKVLVINTGSSSIKYQLFDMPLGTVLCSGLVEKIGEGQGKITQKTEGGKKKYVEKLNLPDHTAGMNRVAALLTDAVTGVIKNTDEVEVVGHRVVHGGETFSKTTFITDDVKNTIDELSSLAPLHNPPNKVGIDVAEKVFSKADQVAVFDTAFHQTLPEKAFRYAIPNKLYKEEGIRVYGFHGTSHRYVTKETAKFLAKPLEAVNLITIHLGNGASMAAIKDGQSVDTSLGLTPMDGLVMGTRSGDIDPGVIFYLAERLSMSVADIKHTLNSESGMKGLTGDNDLRNIEERAAQGDYEAVLALEIYAYRIKKYIGAYLAVLGNIDALVFTAGIGENSPLVRQLSTAGLEAFGIVLDDEKNDTKGVLCDVSTEDSAIRILVVPTNEELEIARQAFVLVAS